MGEVMGQFKCAHWQLQWFHQCHPVIKNYSDGDLCTATMTKGAQGYQRGLARGSIVGHRNRSNDNISVICPTECMAGWISVQHV